MGYSISEFISHAESGDPILITLNTFRQDWVGMIGEQKVWLGEGQETVTLTNGVRTVTTVNNMSMDLGTKFTAQQVLSCFPLHKAILDGMILADVGTVSLSVEPIEDDSHVSNRVWSSAGSTDMNSGANYTGAGPLLSIDTLTFNNTSVVNAIATAALIVKSITVATSYTGTWNDGGFNITTSGDQSFSGTVTKTVVVWTGLHTITGDASMTINANIKTFTHSAASIVLQGTGNLVFNMDAIQVLNLTLAAAGKMTVCSGNGIGCGCDFLTIGSGIFVIDITWGFGVYVGTTCIPIINNATSIICSTYFGVYKIGGDNIVVTLPAMTITGGLEFDIFDGGWTGSSVTFNLNGNISCGGSLFAIGTAVIGASSVFNTNGYSILAGGLVAYNYSGPTLLTCNLGSSIINCSSFTGIFYGCDVGTINFNMGSSQWTCSGDWTFGTVYVVNAGTSKVTINNTSTITSSGKSFNTLVLDADTKTIQTVGALTCSKLQVKPGTTAKFAAGALVTILNYVSGDLSGTASKTVILKSVTDTSAWKLSMPAGVSVSYVQVRDSNASTYNAIDASNGTNTDLTGNTNWVFP